MKLKMPWKHLSLPKYTLESEDNTWQQWTEIQGRKIHGKSTHARRPAHRIQPTQIRRRALPRVAGNGPAAIPEKTPSRL
jgi:hypothetical protein